MTATAALVKALSEPTEPSEVKHRPGPGNRQLSYVDARFVMDRLDETVGPESWTDDYQETALGVYCRIGINIDGQWVWKGDVGTASDIEPAKGAYSDAFKRAAVKWGIGRDLYEGEHSTSPTGNGRSSRPSVTAGRGEPPSSRPAPSREPESPPDEWAVTPIGSGDNNECSIHHVLWNGEWGDLWHKTEDGKYCRHPENTRQEGRRPAGARR